MFYTAPATLSARNARRVALVTNRANPAPHGPKPRLSERHPAFLRLPVHSRGRRGLNSLFGHRATQDREVDTSGWL